MRNFLLSTVLLGTLVFQVGCIVPMYSSQRNERTRQLIYISEGLRHIPQIWERMWALEMPDLATPYRTHGGVI